MAHGFRQLCAAFHPKGVGYILFLLVLASVAETVSISHVRAAKDYSFGRGFLYHEACQTGEGIGALVSRVRPGISLAHALGLKYVCNPLEFETVVHGTGQLGFLFGCNSVTSTSGLAGALVANASVSKLRWVEASLSDVSTGQFAPKPRGDGLLKFFRQPFVASLPNLRLEVVNDVVPSGRQAALRHTRTDDDVVYRLSACASTPTWGDSHDWFRSQFHAVRLAQQKLKQRKLLWKDHHWPRVAVHVRRGDGISSGLAGLPAHHFETALSGLLTALPSLELDMQADIVILAESEDTSEFEPILRRFPQARLLAGAAAEGDGSDGQARLIRDLDAMATSHVLICSHGQFSALGAALQAEPGIALSPHGQHTAVEASGLPNVVQLGPMSQVPVAAVRAWAQQASSSEGH